MQEYNIDETEIENRKLTLDDLANYEEESHVEFWYARDLQTRKQELIEERMRVIARIEARASLTEAEKQLSSNIYQRGVDSQGFGRIRSKGDAALFGGRSTSTMKKRLPTASGNYPYSTAFSEDTMSIFVVGRYSRRLTITAKSTVKSALYR